MARGTVWVVPGKLPANVIVAPNSPRALDQARTAPATREGRIRGRVTRRRTVQRLAPSVRAASSKRTSIERNPASTVITRKGMATKVSATITPGVVKGRPKPVAVATGPPTSPRRPKARRRATPPTTGGSTMGRIATPRSSSRPGNRRRASTQARGTPSRQARAVEASEATSESSRAVLTPGSARICSVDLQGICTARPARGSTKNSAPSPARTSRTGLKGWVGGRTTDGSADGGEPVALERLLPRGVQHGLDEDPGRDRVRGRLQLHDRVAGDDVQAVRDLDPRDRAPRRLDVAHVHDPGIRLAERDFGQHRLHVLLLADRGDRDARLLEDRGRVAPAGDGGRALVHPDPGI